MLKFIYIKVSWLFLLHWNYFPCIMMFRILKAAEIPFFLLCPQTSLLLTLSASRSGSVRILVDELRPVKARYRVPDVIVGEEPSEP